ncbi:hypothetical protein SPFM1_00050 [Salmonella phage SPFM1]|nr:hypothetical protein SPFM1_00050 [Salmonella phage SPFM1]
MRRNPRVDVKFDGNAVNICANDQELLKAHFEPWIVRKQMLFNGEVAMPQLLLRMEDIMNEKLHDIIVNCLLATSNDLQAEHNPDDDLAKQTYQAVYKTNESVVKTPETTSTLGELLKATLPLLACRCGLEFDRVVFNGHRKLEPDPKSYSALLRKLMRQYQLQLQQLMLIAVETVSVVLREPIIVPLSDAVSVRTTTGTKEGESIWTFAALLHLGPHSNLGDGKISAGVDELDNLKVAAGIGTDIYQQKATERQLVKYYVTLRKPVFSIIQQVQAVEEWFRKLWFLVQEDNLTSQSATRIRRLARWLTRAHRCQV